MNARRTSTRPARSRCRPSALALLAAAACSSYELDPIRIDVASNCNHVAVAPLISGIEGAARPWDRVLAMAVDAPGVASGWMLVIRHEPGGLAELAVLYLDAGVIAVDRPLGEPLGTADAFELVPSGQAGVAWLTQGSPGSFRIWRLDAAAIEPVRASQNVAAMPLFCDLDHDDAPESCDSWMWPHVLMFVEQRPVVFTMPPAALDAQIDMWVLPFEWLPDGNLQFVSEIVLHFRPACEFDGDEENELCEALLEGLWFPRLELIGAQRDARASRSAIALYRELDDGTGFVTPDVGVVELYFGDLGLTGTLVTQPGLPPPRAAGPRGLALDTFASYVHYTTTEGWPVLAQLRRDADDDEPFVLLENEGLAIDDDDELVQLDDDIALHRIEDGDWHILKVFPDAPARSETTVYSVPGTIAAVEPAGPSTFVVRREDGRADLVRLACDTTPASELTGVDADP